MLKKILSVLLCIVCVFTLCLVPQVNTHAFFVSGTAALAIGISICASIMLSVGIGIATGNGSVYADTAEYVLYHMPTDIYNLVMDEAHRTIIDGKVVWYCTAAEWNRIKSWFANQDFSTISLTSHLGDISLDGFLPTSTGYTGYGRNPNYNPYFVASTYPYRTMDVNFSNINVYMSWLPTGQLSFLLGDGTFVKYQNIWGDSSLDPNHQNVIGISFPRVDGTVVACTGSKIRGGSFQAVNDLGDLDTKSNITYWFTGSTASISGLQYGTNQPTVTTPGGVTGQFTYDSSNNSVNFNGTTICSNVNRDDWMKYTAVTGSVLSNVSNPYYDSNTNSNVTDFIQEVETKPVAKALPRNGTIQNDETLVIPIPGSPVNPDSPTVPLTKKEVKQREKLGLPVGIVPTVPDMSTETGEDVGVMVLPGTVVDDDTPVYNPAYPSVINPGNETISVTANDDIFPTQATGAETTAFPQEAESAIVKQGEIVSELQKDIVTPLTPDEISKGGNKLKLPRLLLEKFPFCIPYDLYNAITILLAEPEVPTFDIPISVASLHIESNIHIDFSQYESLARILRWFLCAIWTVSLIMLTRKVIWK